MKRNGWPICMLNHTSLERKIKSFSTSIIIYHHPSSSSSSSSSYHDNKGGGTGTDVTTTTIHVHCDLQWTDVSLLLFSVYFFALFSLFCCVGFFHPFHVIFSISLFFFSYVQFFFPEHCPMISFLFRFRSTLPSSFRLTLCFRIREMEWFDRSTLQYSDVVLWCCIPSRSCCIHSLTAAFSSRLGMDRRMGCMREKKNTNRSKPSCVKSNADNIASVRLAATSVQT